MSYSRTSRTKTLLRAQLRLRVMAGVVVVTLLALVAFDIGAVATMRRYLLTQTDSNLHGALTLALPRLAATLALTNQAARAGQHAVPRQAIPPHVKPPFSLPGAFDMMFLPFRGKQVTLQVAANGSAGGYSWTLSPTEFRLLRYFMLNPGRVLTRAQLLDHVWDYDFGGSSTVVSTYVTYLRRKLAVGGPDLIWTQRAVGYSLRLPRPDESQAGSDET